MKWLIGLLLLFAISCAHAPRRSDCSLCPLCTAYTDIERPIWNALRQSDWQAAVGRIAGSRPKMHGWCAVDGVLNSLERARGRCLLGMESCEQFDEVARRAQDYLREKAQ